jgi:hypothetical protein
VPQAQEMEPTLLDYGDVVRNKCRPATQSDAAGRNRVPACCGLTKELR